TIVVPGTTTGGDVLGLVTSNGLCASLDVTGAPIVVESSLSIDDNNLNKSLKIYPNPVIDDLILNNLKGINIKSVNLYDVSGRIVKSINLNNNVPNIRINISNLNTGTYFILIDSDMGQLRKQLMKN
ncbi:putative secreted protein (Por secretion system target), partial [Mariniflexile fucanivorans]